MERRNSLRIARQLWISRVLKHFLAAISPRHLSGQSSRETKPTPYFLFIIGSGRVTFNNTRSFMKAVQASFIEIRSPKFNKKVQIDPYLEDAMCSQCHINPGKVQKDSRLFIEKYSLFLVLYNFDMFPVTCCYGASISIFWLLWGLLFPVPRCIWADIPRSRTQQ